MPLRRENVLPYLLREKVLLGGTRGRRTTPAPRETPYPGTLLGLPRHLRRVGRRAHRRRRRHRRGAGRCRRAGRRGRRSRRHRRRAARLLAHQMRPSLGVETAGHLDVLGLLILAKRLGRARAVDAVDRARIVALVLERLLRLTDVGAALHLPGELVLGVAGRVLDLVLRLSALFFRLVPGLRRLLLRLVPRSGRLVLGLVPGLGRLLLDRVLGV